MLILFCFSLTNDIPATLSYATIVYRLLYDIALDLFDKPHVSSSILAMKCLSRQTSNEPSV